MRSFPLRVAGLTTLSMLILSCSQSPGERIVARVDNVPILTSDLKKVLEDERNHYDPALLSDPEGMLAIQKKILNELIQQRVLLKEADTAGITLSPDEEQKVTDPSSLGYTNDDFDRWLKDQHLSKEDWAMKRLNQKRIDKLMDQEIFSKVLVAAKEVESEYKKHKSHYRVPDRIHCRHIVASKREKAMTIRSLLDKGENFANVAKKYSESPDRENGGDLGWIARGDYPELFEQACFTLVTGQTSDVLASEYGFHIFRVVEKKPGHAKTLKEATPEITESLRRSKGERLMSPWLETLYKKQKIEIDEKTLKEVMP